jgi:hypothetical protein
VQTTNAEDGFMYKSKMQKNVKGVESCVVLEMQKLKILKKGANLQDAKETTRMVNL